MIEPASQDFYIPVMKDILIYAGLAVLLAGALLGLYIALKGFFGSNRPMTQRFRLDYLHPGPQNVRLKPLLRLWVIIMGQRIFSVGGDMSEYSVIFAK